MHDNTIEIHCRHTVRSKHVRSDSVRTVLKASSKKEENGNETRLNDDSGLKEEATKDWIREDERIDKVSVIRDQESDREMKKGKL